MRSSFKFGNLFSSLTESHWNDTSRNIAPWDYLHATKTKISTKLTSAIQFSETLSLTKLGNKVGFENEVPISSATGIRMQEIRFPDKFKYSSLRKRKRD